MEGLKMKMMMKPMIRAAVAVLFFVACLSALSEPQGGKKAPAATCFDQFKALAGDWTDAAGPNGPAQTVRFRLSSGGSVVQEVYFPDTKQEMTNMITRDGSDIVLVHYCMIGNQPRMKAPDKVSGNSVAFTYVDAGNMKTKDDMHMHNVTFTFIDSDTLKESWISFKDGKPAGPADEFIHKRKK